MVLILFINNPGTQGLVNPRIYLCFKSTRYRLFVFEMLLVHLCKPRDFFFEDSFSKGAAGLPALVGLVVLTLSVPVLQLGSHPELYPVLHLLQCLQLGSYFGCILYCVRCTCCSFVGYISNTFYCILYYVLLWQLGLPCAVFCTASTPSATPFAVSNPPPTASVAPSATLFTASPTPFPVWEDPHL